MVVAAAFHLSSSQTGTHCVDLHSAAVQKLSWSKLFMHRRSSAWCHLKCWSWQAYQRASSSAVLADPFFSPRFIRKLCCQRLLTVGEWFQTFLTEKMVWRLIRCPFGPTETLPRLWLVVCITCDCFFVFFFLFISIFSSFCCSSSPLSSNIFWVSLATSHSQAEGRERENER